MTEIHDWGNDMKAYLEWAKEHPCPMWGKATRRVPKYDDEGRSMDKMFDRTHFEQRSYEAYQRLEERA